MSLTGRSAPFLLAVLLVGAGCARSETAEGPATPPAKAEAAPSVEVNLRPVTFEQWRTELSSMRGSIVVVDLWATWCMPCIERFPKMVAMSERYRDKGVRFVSLSLDDRDDETTIPQVTRFLQRNNATGMSNYLMDEIIPDAFDKLDLLGVPAVFVYGPDGELRHRLTGDDPNNQFTEEDVERTIDEMLGEAGGRKG